MSPTVLIIYLIAKSTESKYDIRLKLQKLDIYTALPTKCYVLQ